MKKRKAKKKKTSWGVRPWIVTLVCLVLVFLVGFSAWRQMSRYEQGVLDVYANQQDGYVQLVLEQIQLTEKRGGNEADIEDILATLDASTNRYWTLSKQDALVFVKDVMETNRYQGFTTASYYHTVSAQDFISTLEPNRVTHQSIQIASQPYIASGVIFSFQGSQYRVCLLTNANTVLDHNAYLTAKINLYTLAVIALTIFLISIEIISYLAGKYRGKYIVEAQANRELRMQTEKLNDALHKEDLYDARRTAYTVRALPMLWEKLDGKEPWPLTFLLLQCRGEEEQRQFLQFTQFQMNAKVLRVFLDDTHILLLLIRVEELERSAITENIVVPGVRLTGSLTLDRAPEEPLAQCFNSFLERMLEDEKQTPMQI